MASKTYKMQAIVLKKTKLGEKDLIIEMLGRNGSLVKGVAKGARKPGGSLAARLEIFSTVDVLMAEGRSLDVVCEARIVEARASEFGLEQSAAAAPIVELLRLIAQPELEQPRLFDMARAALGSIASGAAQPYQALSVCAACLWKLMAQSGFRPSFSTCIICGCPVEAESGRKLALSLADGGLVCPSCTRPADAMMVDGDTIRWCEALIRSRFDDILGFTMGNAVFDVLHLARGWVRAHTGHDLKSLDFLFTSGLF